MVSINTQKKLLFIPFVNCSILFIAWFINSKHMINGWQTKLFLYMASAVILSIPLILLEKALNTLMSPDLIRLIIFYIFSVLACFFLILAQKKLLV